MLDAHLPEYLPTIYAFYHQFILLMAVLNINDKLIYRLSMLNDVIDRHNDFLFLVSSRDQRLLNINDQNSALTISNDGIAHCGFSP